MITELEIIRWALYAIGAGFIWFLKRELDNTANRLDNLNQELSSVKDSYLHKNDFREFKSELRNMFEEIKADIRQINHKQQ